MHTQGLKLIKMPASINKQKSDSLTYEVCPKRIQPYLISRELVARPS
jgi:hypothetical protein